MAGHRGIVVREDDPCHMLQEQTHILLWTAAAYCWHCDRSSVSVFRRR
jgi:hypothetical protein